MPQAQTIDETWNGKTVKLAVGEELLIVLAETPTSGFRWKLRATGEPVCRLAGDQFTAPGPKPGAPGQHTWRFAAISPGQTRIELAYQRRWEPSPASQFTVQVEVAGPD